MRLELVHMRPIILQNTFLAMHASLLTCGAWFCADTKGRFDELIEAQGVRLLIDPAALMHVLGTKMDYLDEPLK